jgi:hypothetical protein
LCPTAADISTALRRAPYQRHLNAAISRAA